MSRESKIFTGNPDLVKHYEAFGWELLSANGSSFSMTRETQNPVYPQLVAFENKYEGYRQQYLELNKSGPRPYKKASAGLAFFLLLLGIFPGVLYIVVKCKQKTAYRTSRADHEKKLQKLQIKMTQVVDRSRVVFFSKQ